MSKQMVDDNGLIVSGVFIPGPHQSVTVSGTTARTAANFNDRTTILRLCASTNCYIAFGGGTIEATTAGIFLPAGVPLVVGVPAGATRVAAIQASAGGILSVLEAR